MQQLAELLQKMPGIRSIELKDVGSLAELLRESPEIGSIEVKGLVRHRGGHHPDRQRRRRRSPPMAPRRPAPAAHAAGGRRRRAGRERAARSPASALKEIKSPMVGTFYRRPEPGAEPYVKVGTRVTAGQTVCIIEAMKIMNEIEAEVSGVVREVCVEDAQPVEFGQVLFRVDPNG